MKTLTPKVIKALTKLLSEKFWFRGDAIYPWVHPVNKVQNCLLIRLDGCCQYKFKVCKNGKIRLMRIYSARTLPLGLKPLQTITVDELKRRIALHSDRQSRSFLQMTSPVPVPVDVGNAKFLANARKEALAA